MPLNRDHSTMRGQSRPGSRSARRRRAVVAALVFGAAVVGLSAPVAGDPHLELSSCLQRDPDQVVPTHQCVSLSPSTPNGPHWSNDCNSWPSTTVVDGHFDGSYVKLRSAAVGAATWVCTAVDNGIAHVGAKLTVDGARAVPAADGNQGACSANPATRIFDRSLTVGPTNEPVRLEINVSATELWVCLKVTNTSGLARRLVVPLAPASAVTAAMDGMWSESYPERAPTGSASSLCQLGTGGVKTRVINADIATGHLWSYAWRAPDNRTYVCMRFQTGSAFVGGRLMVNPGPQGPVTLSSDLTPCTVNVISDSGPPPYSIKLSNPASGLPASMCIAAGGISQRITVNAVDPSLFEFAPDLT